MKTLRFILFALCLGTLCSQALAKDKLVEYNYELSRNDIRGVKTSNSDYVIFMVYSYGKREMLTTNICMRNAIHGILFKGLSEEDGLGKVPAIMGSSTYEDHKQYFDEFFRKDYMQFIEETNKGMHDIMKISGKEVKVGLKVKVNIKGLKQRLKKDKILTDFKDMMQ